MSAAPFDFVIYSSRDSYVAVVFSLLQAEEVFLDWPALTCVVAVDLPRANVVTSVAAAAAFFEGRE